VGEGLGRGFANPRCEGLGRGVGARAQCSNGPVGGGCAKSAAKPQRRSFEFKLASKIHRGLLSSPRAANRKHKEISPSTTPKRREVGSSSPNVPTRGQVASCPEEENKKMKFSLSFPSEGGEYHCELNNSDEGIGS
jgi:hypothetical protein